MLTCTWPIHLHPCLLPCIQQSKVLKLELYGEIRATWLRHGLRKIQRKGVILSRGSNFDTGCTKIKTKCTVLYFISHNINLTLMVFTYRW